MAIPATDQEPSTLELARAAITALKSVKPVTYEQLKANGIPARPGLYALWCIDAGALRTIGEPLGGELPPGLLYIGDTGARTMRSGRVSTGTLRTRLASHLGDSTNASASTVRWTFGCLLGLPPCQPEGNNPRFPPDAENTLTAWMREHLQITVWPLPPEAVLRGVEKLVMADLHPPLDLDQAAASPFRDRLMQLRKQAKRLAMAQPCGK
jgi:hypothetical protein